MIKIKKRYRLGCIHGAIELKQHPWFENFPWQDLNNRRLASPFIPASQDNFDVNNIKEEWHEVEEEDLVENENSLTNSDVQA